MLVNSFVYNYFLIQYTPQASEFSLHLDTSL